MTKPKKKLRRKLLLSLSLVGVALAVCGYSYLRKREVVITVQLEKAALRNLTELVVANGKIQPVLQVVINPEVSGEIIDLPVREGQRVSKGELLLKIKPDNYRAARNSAHASHQSALASKRLAQANLTKEEIEYKRAQDMAKGRLISESQLLEAKTICEVMQATFDTSIHLSEQAAATLAKAEDDLAKTTIYAPMPGTVTRLKSQQGERVVGTALMAGTEIMTIADLEQMEARVDIGEVDVVLINTGQVAKLEVDAFKDRKFAGIVTEIANSSKGSGSAAAQANASSAQQEATKFEIKIRIQDKELFRPGMSVTAEIETRSRTNVLAIPIQSVTTRVPKKAEDKSPAASSAKTNAPVAASSKAAKEAPKPIEVVFTLEGDHVKMVPVKRGISDDAYVEITEGLKEGTDVISGGYKAINRELEDGKRVIIKEGVDQKTPEDKAP